MRIVTIKMPEVWIEEIDQLVMMGYYASRSDFIREAVRRLLEEYREKIRTTYPPLIRKVPEEEKKRRVKIVEL